MNNSNKVNIEKKNILQSTLFIVIGVVGFLVCTTYQHDFYSPKINLYSNLSQILIQVVAFAFLLVAICGLGYLLGGFKTGFRLMKYGAILLYGAMLIGYIHYLTL